MDDDLAVRYAQLERRRRKLQKAMVALSLLMAVLFTGNQIRTCVHEEKAHDGTTR